MPDIKITDSVSATADLQFNDTSALAKAGLKQIISHTNPFVAALNTPVDKSGLKEATYGAKFSSPAQLIANAAKLTINADACGSLKTYPPAAKKLFGDDFTPEVPIAADEYWMSMEVDTSLSGKVAATIDGVGIALEGATSATFTTYTLFKGQLPSLKDAITAALNNYSVDYNVAVLRNQPVGTVNVSDLSGSVKLSGSYSVPISVNALASAKLPFDQTFALQPDVTLKLTGEIKLTGQFVVRSHRVSANELRLGVYKKMGSSFKATFTASAGIGANVAGKELISTFVGAVFKQPDISQLGISGKSATALNDALRDCVDHSFSVSLNAICSASTTDEAAVTYSVDLSTGDNAKTDEALASALRGDWSALAALPNAKSLRDITRDTETSERKLIINLLGLYNAETVDQFTKTCTILHDGAGNVVVTDKVTASHLAAAAEPFRADPDKLRSALSEGFLATVTYVAGGSAGTPHIGDVKATQTYFSFEDDVSRTEMRQHIMLGQVLNLIPPGSWDAIIAAHNSFGHVRVEASANYDSTSAMKLFFKDPDQKSARTLPEFETIGRQVLAALIDPESPNGSDRIRILKDDATWAAMDDKGAVATFNTIDGLKNLNPNALAVVGSDWTDVTWWADAMSKVTPKLSLVLSALKATTAADPTADRKFMKARRNLEAAIGQVTRNSRAAFAGGWGVAVMETVCQFAAPLTMDITADNNIVKHYQST
jgi:hypothetical protein